MADGEQLEVLIIQHTAGSGAVRSRRAALQGAGFLCGEPVKLGALPVRAYDAVVLMGVGDDIAGARQVVATVEECYPMCPVLVVSHHQDKNNIKSFKGRSAVLFSEMSDENFIALVHALATQPAPED